MIIWCIFKGLSFKFERGKNILISGISGTHFIIEWNTNHLIGSGKSSILRVLKKLWQPLKGILIQQYLYIVMVQCSNYNIQMYFIINLLQGMLISV